MLTSKQRAYLRSLANSIDTILIVGKGGISQETITQAEEALMSRELIKGRVLETAAIGSKSVAMSISEQTDSEVVSVIGTKFILYKKNPKQPKIVLPKQDKKVPL